MDALGSPDQTSRIRTLWEWQTGEEGDLKIISEGEERRDVNEKRDLGRGADKWECIHERAAHKVCFEGLHKVFGWITAR